MSAKKNIQDIYPLTPMQEGMLFHAVNPDTASAYFEQMSYRICGTLDIDTVKASLNDLMKRHDILRTVFIHSGVERPVQVVLKERQCDFSFEDISGLEDPAEKKAVVEELKTRDRRRSFDLSKDVLLRVAIVKVAEDDYRFTWSHPHIIMDGWCMGIVIAEFLEFYKSNLAKRAPQLATVKPYKSYIQWLQQRNLAESLDFWDRYLGDYRNYEVIPRIKTGKEGGKGFEKKMKIFNIDETQTTALKKLAAQNRVTLNNLVQTVWAIVLSRYGGEQDVVFGVVVSGRPAEVDGIEAMVGLFINTVPMRVRVEQEKTFTQLLKKVGTQALAAEPHHYCPLAAIQSRTALKQDLIDHIVSYQNFPVAERIESLSTTAAKETSHSSFTVADVESYEHTNYDFVLLAGARQRMQIKLDYNVGVYDTPMIEKIAADFQWALSQDLDRITLDELKLMQDQDKKERILARFNENLEDE